MKPSSFLNLGALWIMLSSCCIPTFFMCEIAQVNSERRALVLSDSTSEQKESQPGPAIPDIYGGLAVATLAGDSDPGTTNKWVTGPLVGLEWQLYQYKNFLFNPSVQYSFGGGKEVTEHHDLYYSYSYATHTRFHSLDLQPYVRYDISDSFSLLGGPRLSYLLSAKRTHENNGRTSATVKSKEGFKDIELGVGIGFTYRIPNAFLRINATYNHGFTNRLDDPMYNMQKKSRNAQLTLVYDIANGIANQKRSRH